MTIDPTVSFGTPVDGKPFELTYAWEDEQAVLFLTVTQLRNLVASGDAALVEHRQATCQHEFEQANEVEPSWDEVRCRHCNLDAVLQGDTFVPVGEGT